VKPYKPVPFKNEPGKRFVPGVSPKDKKESWGTYQGKVGTIVDEGLPNRQASMLVKPYVPGMKLSPSEQIVKDGANIVVQYPKPDKSTSKMQTQKEVENIYNEVYADIKAEQKAGTIGNTKEDIEAALVLHGQEPSVARLVALKFIIPKKTSSLADLLLANRSGTIGAKK